MKTKFNLYSDEAGDEKVTFDAFVAYLVIYVVLISVAVLCFWGEIFYHRICIVP